MHPDAPSIFNRPPDSDTVIGDEYKSGYLKRDDRPFLERVVSYSKVSYSLIIGGRGRTPQGVEGGVGGVG